MEQITIRIPADTLEDLEAEADEHDVSRSEHIRDVLEHRSEFIQEHAELQQELERVRREKRQVLEQREEHTELVKAVQTDRTLQQRKEQAGIVTRAKWLLVGMPGDEG